MNIYVPREHTRMCMPRLLQNYDCCYFARKNNKKKQCFQKENLNLKVKFQKFS